MTSTDLNQVVRYQHYVNVPTPGHPPPLSVSCHTHSDCPSTAFLLFIFPPMPPAITTNSKRTNRALTGFQSLPTTTLALLQTDVFQMLGGQDQFRQLLISFSSLHKTLRMSPPSAL
ncbi:hypothetical protein Q8A73_018178 [Channa argus]|nr:hypothetical protein Q8A73_018178 [Channa argus]